MYAFIFNNTVHYLQLFHSYHIHSYLETEQVKLVKKSQHCFLPSSISCPRASEHARNRFQNPGTPWNLQISSYGKCPSATSGCDLHPLTPELGRWRSAVRRGGQQKRGSTATLVTESRREDLGKKTNIHGINERTF